MHAWFLTRCFLKFAPRALAVARPFAWTHETPNRHSPPTPHPGGGRSPSHWFLGFVTILLDSVAHLAVARREFFCAGNSARAVKEDACCCAFDSCQNKPPAHASDSDSLLDPRNVSVGNRSPARDAKNPARRGDVPETSMRFLVEQQVRLWEAPAGNFASAASRSVSLARGLAHQ